MDDGGRGFAPDRGDPLPTGRPYSAPRSPSLWVGVLPPFPRTSPRLS